MTRAVHQLLPVFSYGDAIGGATVRTQRMLRKLGYRSEIFAGLIDRRFAGSAFPAADLLTPSALDPGDAVLYRLSVGSPLARTFESLPARRVLWFHNITPPEYFRQVSETVAYWTERGWNDLRRLAPRVDGVIADSSFNLREAQQAGGGADVPGWVVPIFDVARLRPRASHPTAPPTILFVGRVAPSKCHEDLIRAVAALRATGHPEARLTMLGTADDCKPYLTSLQRLIAQVDVGDAVALTGKRSTDAEVAAAYASATLFASASEHEGFCVPLLEAMAFGVPVVAHDAGAVAETIGGAGLVLDSKDPLVWAEAFGRVIDGGDLRQGLVAAGRHRLGDFDDGHSEARLREALHGLGLGGG